MKKLFFSLMALVAVCVGLVSCDAAEDLIIKKLVEPACSKLAGLYENGDGSTLELTESGNYIYTADEAEPASSAMRTRAELGNHKIVLTGKFTVEAGDVVVLSGDVKGKVDTKNGNAEIKVGENELKLQAKKNTSKIATEDLVQYCRTWVIESQAKVDGKKVTISDKAYAEYFGSFGYPKKIIISALGTFCVECANDTYVGKWKTTAKKNTIYVEEGTFMGEIPFEISDFVKVTINATDNNGKAHTIEAILDEE